MRESERIRDKDFIGILIRMEQPEWVADGEGKLISFNSG